jgi:hypothetical protein
VTRINSPRFRFVASRCGKDWRNNRPGAHPIESFHQIVQLSCALSARSNNATKLPLVARRSGTHPCRTEPFANGSDRPKAEVPSRRRRRLSCRSRLAIKSRGARLANDVSHHLLGRCPPAG